MTSLSNSRLLKFTWQLMICLSIFIAIPDVVLGNGDRKQKEFGQKEVDPAIRGLKRLKRPLKEQLQKIVIEKTREEFEVAWRKLVTEEVWLKYKEVWLKYKEAKQKCKEAKQKCKEAWWKLVTEEVWLKYKEAQQKCKETGEKHEEARQEHEEAWRKLATDEVWLKYKETLQKCKETQQEHEEAWRKLVTEEVWLKYKEAEHKYKEEQLQKVEAKRKIDEKRLIEANGLGGGNNSSVQAEKKNFIIKHSWSIFMGAIVSFSLPLIIHFVKKFKGRSK